MPHNRQMMNATKKTKSHAQALPGMAKDEAKVADVVHLLGTSRSGGPFPRAPLPPNSLDDDDEERSGGSSLDDEFLSYLSGSDNMPPPVPPPLSVVAMVPASASPSALAAPHAQYADFPPRPSAPPLELLLEEGYFDGPTGDHPTTDVPPPGDEGHARMTRLAEAAVVLMPVCEAVRTVGPTPAQDEEDNDALADWTVKCGKCMMIGVASLVLVALGTLIGVVVMLVKQDDPVTTITSSTVLMTSTTSTAILTSTTRAASSQPTEFTTTSSPNSQPTEFPATRSPSSKPTNSPSISPSGQPTKFPTTSSPSTSSTTPPEMNTVSEKSTDFMLVVFLRRRSTSHAFIFRYLHWPSSQSPPSRPQVGRNGVQQSSEMQKMTCWECPWLSLRMPRLLWLELLVLVDLV